VVKYKPCLDKDKYTKTKARQDSLARRLSDSKIEELIKASKCFNCQIVGHRVRD